MELKNPLLVVTDMEKSVAFYEEVLGLRVIADFGANKTLTGGLCLQTLETWRDFIDGKPVAFGCHAGEIYFEEADFDDFAEKLNRLSVAYVHPVKEHSWGQRVVRFYDPDHHVIEVGEKIETVCRRFLNAGMMPEEIAQRMDVPLEFVKQCLK